MNTKKTALFASTIAALGLTATVQAANEVEPNNSIFTAQYLTGASSHSITAMMGTIGAGSHDDLDFYTFEAEAGDVLDIDIDNGYGGNGNFNSILGVFDANGRLLRMNAYASSVDAGSSSTLDARIDKFVAPASGTYIVGVSDVPRYFIDGGATLSFFGTTTSSVGDYTLNISGITYVSKTQQINIEIKPGNNELSPLNPWAKGKVPVAILGSANFDVSRIKEETLRFGSTGKEKSLSKCQKVLHDINHDGFDDMLCHFENRTAGFKGGDIEGIVSGDTDTGISFEGRSLLKVVPSKRK